MSHVRLTFAGLLAVAAVAACGGSAGAPAPRPATTTPPAAATAGASSAGCTNAPALSQTLHLAVAGAQRTVIVHAPANAPSGPRPLVLNLHGSTSDAAAQVVLTGMDAAADADGFIVAYPQALIAAGTGFDWNVPGVPLAGGKEPPKSAPNDVSFLTGLVATLEGRYCIDPARVYATGFSGGGRMASQLACDAPAVFAAVAPVSGLRFPTACPTGRPVPVIAFHGTADPVDPYGGHGQPYWTYSVPQAAADWGRREGCAASPATETGAGFTLTAYAGCALGSRVELYSITGEGHEWPGGPRLPKAITRPLGPQSKAVDANATMWAFFAAHPLS